MDVQILQTVGAAAGLAGVAMGMILLLYRELLRKKIFPRLSQKDAYRLLRHIALLSWSVAMTGIISWGWSQAITHPGGSEDASSRSTGPLVVAGTAVHQMTNAVALSWYKPAVAKRLIPLLARNLLCRSGAQDIDKSIVADTLAELGDENTIVMLQKMAAERTYVCGNDDEDSLGKTHLDKLTQRIRDRIK